MKSAPASGGLGHRESARQAFESAECIVSLRSMGEHHGCWPSTDAKFPLSLADIQRRIVIGVCLEQGWNRAKASLELEVSTRTLDHWLDRYRKDGAPIPPGRGFRWRKGKSA